MFLNCPTSMTYRDTRMELNFFNASNYTGLSSHDMSTCPLGKRSISDRSGQKGSKILSLKHISGTPLAFQVVVANVLADSWAFLSIF